METPHAKFLLVLGIVIWLKQAHAINCYNCSLEDKCNDPFKSSGVSIIPCSGPCFKTKASNSNVQVVIRGCETMIQTEKKCIDVSVNRTTARVCWCNESFCNYALPVGSSIIVMTALIEFPCLVKSRSLKPVVRWYMTGNICWIGIMIGKVGWIVIFKRVKRYCPYRSEGFSARLARSLYGFDSPTAQISRE